MIAQLVQPETTTRFDFRPQLLSCSSAEKVRYNLSALSYADAGTSHDGIKIVKHKEGKKRHTTVVSGSKVFVVTAEWKRGRLGFTFSTDMSKDTDEMLKAYGAALCATDRPFGDCENDLEREGWLERAKSENVEIKTHSIGEQVTIKLIGVHDGYEIHYVVDGSEDGIEVESVDEPEITSAEIEFGKAVDAALVKFNDIFGKL